VEAITRPRNVATYSEQNMSQIAEKISDRYPMMGGQPRRELSGTSECRRQVSKYRQLSKGNAKPPGNRPSELLAMLLKQPNHRVATLLDEYLNTITELELPPSGWRGRPA